MRQMGRGQIAHSIGVHPGMGKAAPVPVTPPATGAATTNEAFGISAERRPPA